MANVNVGGVYATFRAQNRQFLQATRQNLAALKRTRTGMRETSRSVAAFRSVALRSVGAISALAAGFASINTILRNGLAVDRSFTQLETLVGLSTKEVRGLRKELQGIAADEGLNLQELADGAFFLASAGVEAANVGEVITAAGKAAELGLGPINKVAEALTTSLGAWGDAAEDAETETAILVATARLGRFPVEQFARQWSRVAGLAPAIGVTSREVSALLATLSRTLNLEQSATSLRTLFAQLNTPPEKAVKVLRQVGVSVDDIRKSIRQRGLLATLIQLQEQLEAVGLTFTDAFRSQEAATAFAVLSTNDWQTARELLEDVNQVVGEDLQKSFLGLERSVSGQFRQSLNRLQAQLVRLAQIVLPPLIKTFAFVVENLDKVRFAALFLAGILIRRLYFSQAAAAALVFAKGLFTASGAMTALTAATNFLRAALIRIGFGIFIVAIGEGIYQLSRFVSAMGGIRNAFQAAAAVGREVFERISFNFELLQIAVADLILGLRISFTKALIFIPEIVRHGLNTAIGYFTGFYAATREVINALPDVFRAIFTDIINLAKVAANSLVNRFKEAINLIAAFLDIDVRLELSDIETDPTQIGRTLKDVGNKAGAAFKDGVQEAVEGGPLVDNRLLDNLVSLEDRQRLLNYQRDIANLSEASRRTDFSDIVEGFKDVEDAGKAAGEGINTTIKSIEDFQIGGAEAVADANTKATETAIELSESAKNLQRLAGDIGDAFGDFASQTITNFKNIGQAARELGRVIVDSLIKRLIASPIANAITGGLSTLFGVPGLQSGGLGSGLTLVGEAGPELVDFRKPGRVYSNDALAAALNNQQSSNVFNFAPVINSSDSAAVNRALAEAYPIFENRVLSTIQLDARRRSGLRQSLRG